MSGDQFTGEMGLIAASFGPEVAWAFVFAFGGERHYVPTRPSTGSRVMKAVPDHEAERFCREFGGLHIDVPMASAAQRKRMVARLLSEGYEVNLIIRMVRLSRRSFYRIKAELQAEGGLENAAA